MSILKEILEQAKNDGTPLGALRVLVNFDLEQYIQERIDVGRKDVARLRGFLPSLIARASELTFEVGVKVGQAANGENELALEPALKASAEFRQLVNETVAIVEVFHHQFKHMSISDLDPFANERESLRIYAKRNGFNAAYQELLGVSERTPDDYDAMYREKYLDNPVV